MTATVILDDLQTRGIRIWAETDQLKLNAPQGTITPELQTIIRDHKTELLALLRSKMTERPRLGSFARPMPVRGTLMPSDCLWATCEGFLSGQDHSIYRCGGCGTLFELLPPEDLGIYVG